MTPPEQPPIEPEPQPKPFPEPTTDFPPAQDGGPDVIIPTVEYSSTSWPSSKTLTAGQKFERMKLLTVGSISPTAKIENGTLKVTGNSPRVYFDGPWQDVEFSSDVLAVSNIQQSYLVARSDHEDRPCGFGGYDLYVDIADKNMFLKKEIHHAQCPDDGLQGYSGRLGSVSIDVKEGVSFNQKIRVTNIEDGKVKIEGFFNNQKKLEIIDDGSIACGGKKTPPYTRSGKWCYTRANAKDGSKAGEIHYKNLSVKPI